MQRTNLDLVTYRLLHDAYSGTGGFQNGTYLVKHKRETDEKYANRQRLAYFLNYVKPVVDQKVIPIFARDIQREINNTLYKQFVDNVDSCGTYLSDFMREAALKAKLYGEVFIVMDNYSAEQQPDNLADVMQHRKFPFVYLVTLDMIEDIQTDKYGNITEFAFQEKVDRDDLNRTDYVIHRFTENEYITHDITTKKEIRGTHNLGRVPVIPFKAYNTADLVPPSEFLSVAFTNKAVYNLCSWLSEIFQSQTFSILTYPTDSAESISNLVVGTENALAYPADSSNRPDFIQPSADPATIIMNQIEKLISEIYRMAGLSAVTGVRQSVSGVSKAYDYQSLNHDLADFAAICEAIEYQIVDLFAAYVNQDINAVIAYKRNYNISDVNEDIDNAERILNLPVDSATLKEQVMKKLVNAYFNENISDEDKDKIDNEVHQYTTAMNVVNYEAEEGAE